MYIEPNISILKKISISTTIVLAVVFAVFFVIKTPQVEEASVVGVSGQLIKEDGVYLVDNQVIAPTESLDSLLGKSIAIVGSLDENGLLHIDQLLTSPDEPEIEKQTNTNVYRATTNSSAAFSVSIPEDWLADDRSITNSGRIILSKENARIDMIRYPDGEDIDLQFEPVPVSEQSITINGFSYILQRAIAQKTRKMIDHVEPSEVCLQDEACPRFIATSNESNPYVTQVLTGIMQNLVFLPEPQGWKILRHSIAESDWNLYLYYPDEVTVSSGKDGYQLLENGVEVISIQFVDDATKRRDQLKDVTSQLVVLPTREENQYQTGPDTYEMILRTPDDTQDIIVVGNGAVFNAVMRTFVFEEK